jgi:hypothetical protein
MNHPIDCIDAGYMLVGHHVKIHTWRTSKIVQGDHAIQMRHFIDNKLIHVF